MKCHVKEVLSADRRVDPRVTMRERLETPTHLESGLKGVESASDPRPTAQILVDGRRDALQVEAISKHGFTRLHELRAQHFITTRLDEKGKGNGQN